MKKLPELAFQKPPPVVSVAEEDAQRFERNEHRPDAPAASMPKATPVAAVSSVQSSSSGPTKKGSKLKRDSLGERVTIYLPPKLADAVRRRCLKERRSVSDALTEAAETWVGAGRRPSSINE